jgi:hypothetical protein
VRGLVTAFFIIPVANTKTTLSERESSTEGEHSMGAISPNDKLSQEQFIIDHADSCKSPVGHYRIVQVITRKIRNIKLIAAQVYFLGLPSRLNIPKKKGSFLPRQNQLGFTDLVWDGRIDQSKSGNNKVIATLKTILISKGMS